MAGRGSKWFGRWQRGREKRWNTKLTKEGKDTKASSRVSKTFPASSVLRQVALPVTYEGMTMEAGFRLDLVVDDAIIIEVKAVEALSRLHEAQILTYLRLSGLGMGFLMNFNVVLFKQGLRRFVQ